MLKHNHGSFGPSSVTRLKRGLHVVGAAILLASFSTAAEADVVCAGVVTSVVMETNGLVKAAHGFGDQVICDITGGYTVTAGVYGSRTITQVQCQALLSNFLTAKAQNASVSGYFAGTTCPVGNIQSNYPQAWIFPGTS